MLLRSLYLTILFAISLNTYSSENVFKDIYIKIAESQFDEALEILDKNQKVKSGEWYYLNAICNLRIDEAEKAEKYFKLALKNRFIPKDIYYEYAQTLYTQDKSKKALKYFKRSIKKRYKRAVSLYYMAYISQEKKDYKKAVSFYKMIEKLPKKEKKEILQASRLQIADIYLAQVEKVPDSFESVEKYVIPQYENALKVDKKSALADDIRKKIDSLLKKYDLILFKMRNGRPTARPPFFLKANILYGNDNNINIANKDSLTEVLSSSFYSYGVFGRYTFYPNNIISISPEFSFSTRTYNSSEEDITDYNTQSYTFNLKTNYEHQINKKQATTYLTLGQTQNLDSKQQTVSISEEMNLWKKNASTFSYSLSTTTADETTESNTLTSFSFEQLIELKSLMFYFYSSLDTTVYPDLETSDSIATTYRLDVIFPTFFKLFNPSIFGSLTTTEYYNSEFRGTPSLTSYGIILSRPLGKKFYLTVDYSASSQTADDLEDEYTKQTYGLNIDYFY